MSLRVIKSGLLVIVGVPIAFNGLLVSVAPALIRSAYGVTSQDADVVALLRHRAVLLLLIGGLLTVSGLRRQLRPAAIPVATFSMIAFVIIAVSSETNSQQRQVAFIDAGLLVLLTAAAAIRDHNHNHNHNHDHDHDHEKSL